MRLGLRALLRTTTFRVALGQAAVILVFVIGVLAYLYIATVGQVLQEVDRAVDAEFKAIEEAYGEGGEQGVSQLVLSRWAEDGPGLYVFTSASGELLAGDFTALPVNPGPEPQRVDFAFERSPRDANPDRGQARGKIGRLLGGQVLLVARDLGDGARVTNRITRAFWIILLIGVAMSVVGGLVAARQSARRAGALSAVTQRVMAGDLSTRAKIRGIGDEYDTLAGNLNMMLDQLERLVHTVRTAGDGIAHDLRSPLVRMRNRIDATLDDPPDATHDRETMVACHDEIEILLELIGAILRLSRLESAGSWEYATIDLSQLGDELGEFWRPAAEEAGLSYSLRIGQGALIQGDRSLIIQSLSNLIENAIKYTPLGGSIEVTIDPAPDGGAVLSVADDGPGIPEGDRLRVLERFVRLEQSRTSPGAGLGLSLVAAVVRLHKGEISLADGLGTPPASPGLRVTMTLPAKPR